MLQLVKLLLLLLLSILTRMMLLDLEMLALLNLTLTLVWSLLWLGLLIRLMLVVHGMVVVELHLWLRMLWLHSIQRDPIGLYMPLRKGRAVLANSRGGRPGRKLPWTLSFLSIVIEMNELLVPNQKITNVHVSSSSHEMCVR